MDLPITMTKLHKAIQHMSNKKAVEADDFLAEFYKTMANNSTHFIWNSNRY